MPYPRVLLQFPLLGPALAGCFIFSFIATVFPVGSAWAQGSDRFRGVDAWNCTIQASMNEDIEEATGPGGMADSSKRSLFQALEDTGMQMETPGGNTDSYHQVTTQTIEGKIRLHYVYDGGEDGIQIAGWNNGTADVHLKSFFEGTEQNKTIFRDKTASYDGGTEFYGDEYSPGFQIWVYPADGVYAMEYALAPVTARQVEHCHMKEGMEGDRRKAESATDADMPLGGFFSGLTKFTCATEKVYEVDLEGGAMSGLVENIPLPRSGAVFEGEGDSAYIDSSGVKIRWSCKPE